MNTIVQTPRRSVELGFQPVDLYANDLIQRFSTESCKAAERASSEARVLNDDESLFLCLISRDVEMTLSEAHGRFGGYDPSQVRKFLNALDVVLPLMREDCEARKSMTCRRETVAAFCDDAG